MATFKAIRIDKAEKGTTAALTQFDEAELMEGDVTVRVEYSALNYKDGLAVTGKAPVVRRFPMIAGIDLAGTVEHSSHPQWKAGDKVICTGWGMGETHLGAYAEKARVKGDWLVRLPAGMSTRDAMAIGTAGFTAMLAVLALETPAGAVEYRLKVASIFDQSLTSFLSYGELNDGATGPGFQQLEAGLDQGTVGRGVMITHRPLNSVPSSIARAWGGISVPAQIARGGVVSFWDEVRWDGRPGERSIWIVKPDGRERPQAVKRVVLKGTTPLTIYRPYAVACGKTRVPVMDMPIPLMAFQESRGDVWDKYVAKNIDMRHGVGVVVGVNNQGVLADLVYIIVEQGPNPTTFEVVMTWYDRDVESPGGGGPVLMRYDE